MSRRSAKPAGSAGARRAGQLEKKRGTGALIWGWWLNVLREFRPEIVGAFDAIADRSGRR